MVSVKIVSRYNENPPSTERTDLKIPSGPLYPAEEVIALLESRGSAGVSLWTRKCINDLQKYEWDTEDAAELITTALQHGRFIGAEWCTQKEDGPWVAADAYAVSRREWVAYAHREMNIEYYVKFAISKTGQILLLISCHLSENRR